MPSQTRAALGGLFLLVATAAHGQISATDRARDLLAGTTGGHPNGIACADLDEAVGRALIDLGGKLRGESLDRALVALRLAETAGRCLHSDRLTGSALNDLSFVLNLHGDNDAALEAARESQRIHERLKDDSGLAQAWNLVGNVHWTRGEMHDALGEYRRALELWTAVGDRPSEARALNNVGNVQRAFGAFDEALGNYAEALQIFEGLGDRLRAAVVTDNMGVAYFTRGDYASALDCSRRALAIQRELGNEVGVGKSLDSIGNIYRALGAYRPALESFDQALKVRTTVGDNQGVMETSHNIGLVYFSQGDYELAIDAYKRGLRLNRAQHDRSFDAEALRNIGAAAWRLGQTGRAAANFRASLAIAHREGLRTHEGELLHDLGEAALARGNRRGAAQLFDRALRLRRAIGDQAGITESLTSLASAGVADQRPDAIAAAEQAVQNAVTHDQPELLWRAQTVAGIANRRAGRADDARRLLSEAIRTIEQLSSQVVASENLRQRFFEDKLSPYHELIAIDIEQHSVGDALELAERSKARVLTQLLRGSRTEQAASLTAAEKVDQVRLRDALFSRDREIEAEAAKPNRDAGRLGALEAARREARDELAAFETAVAARHPELARARGRVEPLTLADASRIVTDPTTAVVEYAIDERQLFTFLVTSDGGKLTLDARAVDVGSAELASRAERFRDQIASRDLEAPRNARDLYRLLLEPFASRLVGRTRLVIIPDGALWMVPFQALLGPRGYVIESAAVSYAPSMTVLREIQRLPASRGRPTLLAMGKSVFGPSFEPLPDADDQVRLIRDAYGADRSATYLDDAATETQFKIAAPHYHVLHLATHGVFDEASPLYSHLVLSIDHGNPEEDGRLEAWEIMRLKLAADLVVLSACDTGRGRVAPGEGVVGMMWALLAAGARAMVVSQFPVESKSATALLVGFHRRLAAGRAAKTDDLRAAALELLRTPRFAHPYYWAGFILVGDGQ